MRILKKPLAPSGDLWFQHKSPHGPFNRLESQTYETLIDQRSEDMDPENAVYYVEEREEHETLYHEMLGSDASHSFTYATVVGFELMESPEDYPGNTHYFKLTIQQLNECVFELVAGKDHTLDVEPSVGVKGLLACVTAWSAHFEEYESYQDDVVGGTIDPRIEVIIPFTVEVLAVYPEKELR